MVSARLTAWDGMLEAAAVTERGATCDAKRSDMTVTNVAILTFNAASSVGLHHEEPPIKGWGSTSVLGLVAEIAKDGQASRVLKPLQGTIKQTTEK